MHALWAVGMWGVLLGKALTALEVSVGDGCHLGNLCTLRRTEDIVAVFNLILVGANKKPSFPYGLKTR